MPRPHRSPLHVRALLIVAALALVLGSVAAVRAADLTDPSPAVGHAEIIAQGMAAPAADRVVWRVVRRTLPLRADARPSNRMPDGAGFLLAGDKPIFVTDQGSKLRSRLAPGEATFVPSGANQTWASLGEKVANAYSLELTARDNYTTVDAKGELIDNSNSFSLPEGDYDLDLARDVLDVNERANLATGDYPALIFATSGELEIRSDASESAKIRIAAGEAQAFTGNLIIRGLGEKGSAFVAAVIGPSIGGGPAATDTTPAPGKSTTPKATAEATATAKPKATPKPTSTPTPAPEATSPPSTAVLTLDVRVCPSGMRPATLNVNACTGLPGGYNLNLVGDSGLTLGIGDAPLVAPNTIQWSGLPADTYELLIAELPTGFDTVALDGYVCCTPRGGFTLVIDDGAQLYGTLTFFQPAVAAAPPTAAAPPAVDSDGDGLTDVQETNIYGTNPLAADTDGDGVVDSVEISAGSNPLDPASFPR